MIESRLFEKLTVLGEGAKYDASCSTSGVARSNVGRVGNAACAGICHSWAADGRCISLLKVLLSNDCVYDCKYCVNRRSADVKRCSFEPQELAALSMEFYRRNYIEGLFLSSAVVISPDHTAERMYACLRLLRETYGFAGYIHVKVLPGLSPELLNALGFVSDRMSVNVELPSGESLKKLAPQKKPEGIFTPMRQITQAQVAQRTLQAPASPKALKLAGLNAAFGDGSAFDVFDAADRAPRGMPETEAGMSARNSFSPAARRENRYREQFAPAGQTTQMIIGASPESDRRILRLSESMYRRFSLKRVYFSAYIPVASHPDLPAPVTPPPLKREHRLYQADWLLRFYGFTADEILSEENPNLDYDLDPKIVWALRHIDRFPVEINKASREELLRIPGVGSASALRIMRQRRVAAVRYEDLKKMGVVLKRARFFLTCSGRYCGDGAPDPNRIRDTLIADAQNPQISMFEAFTHALPVR
ncbi:MAG: putative DNA modification/repair radical SAM protein [Clostridiales Family XIII bacterium]|jgi:putative DNA modification/repair radical SAM protein|nr:putative DNA modification/repair radical SAM protein [Clostridiales Family XIII bacterium]